MQHPASRIEQDAELRTLEYALVARVVEDALNIQQRNDMQDVFSQINATVKHDT